MNTNLCFPRSIACLKRILTAAFLASLLFNSDVFGKNDPLSSPSTGVQASDSESPYPGNPYPDNPTSIQQFRLMDGSIVSVDYDSGFVSVQLGFAGPRLREEFIEDDFGGVFWEWGQLVPSENGTWTYRDWFDTGYQSIALPLYFYFQTRSF